MILLIVPLLLILMILVIFYVYDLHLSIKSSSKTIDSLFPSDDSLLNDNDYLLYDDADLSGVDPYDFLQSTSTNERNPPYEEDLLTDDEEDEVSIVDESDKYIGAGDININPEITTDVTADVTADVIEPSGTDIRISYLESVIADYLSASGERTSLATHNHGISLSNRIYQSLTNTKLCDFSANHVCDNDMSCAIQCNESDNCSGWVNDISNGQYSTCEGDTMLQTMTPDGCTFLGFPHANDCGPGLVPATDGSWNSVMRAQSASDVAAGDITRTWLTYPVSTTDPL